MEPERRWREVHYRRCPLPRALIGGPLGAGISVLGDVIDWISGQIQLAGLSDEEKAAFARSVIRDQSEFLDGYEHPTLACGIEFSFRYAQE